MVTFTGFSTRGIRGNNEDAFLAGNEVFAHDSEDQKCDQKTFDTTARPIIFAIADGMGGQEAGEVASRLALTLLAEAVDSIQELTEPLLHDIILTIHHTIVDCGAKSGKPDMGCTLTGCIFSGDLCWVFNVGDSRTYKIQSGYAVQITNDHSANSLPGMQHLDRNIIYSCLGGGIVAPVIDIFSLEGRLKTGTILVMCSDGFHEAAGADQLEYRLAGGFGSEACVKLVNDALSAGSDDNITLCMLLID